MRLLGKILRTGGSTGPRLNAILFLGTFLTTTVAGCYVSGANPVEEFHRGIPFSASLLGILLCHEFGHYIAARCHRTRASLPYFLPAPTLIGTFGAIIRVRSRIPNRRALLDIGVAGPLAGFVAALGVTIYGLSRSTVIEVSGEGLVLGSSLLFHLLERGVIGPTSQALSISLDSVAFAGWLGLLVTTINLLPIGQLDGGHITYALFGRGHALVARMVIGVMFGLSFLWVGWIVWGTIVLVIGLRHPAPQDDRRELDWGRKLLGGLTLAILIISFVPVPIHGLGLHRILVGLFWGTQ